MDSSQATRLPTDLLHLLCVELADQLDFSTLYRCAVSSKLFATAGAIPNLYRICGESPVRSGGSEALSFAEQELTVQRWSILWRTIILSSLGGTMYSYCRYLRVLDLRDLTELLDDDKFRGRIAQNFFKGDLSRFNITIDTPIHMRSGKTRRPVRLSTRSIISAIGGVVIEQAPLLEALTEPIMADVMSSALLTWAPRLERLQFLQLGNGAALRDDAVQALLCSSCPQLGKIDIYQWTQDDHSDAALARFLNRMRPNSLTYFENHSDCGIGQETCRAFGSHSKSLTTLKLAVGDKGVPGLALLQPCTSLEGLKLTDLRPPHDLVATQNDVFSEMVTWLQQCAKLQDISLINFISAPALLTPMLEKADIKLDALQINATEHSMYAVKDNQDFHRAIAKQKSLTRLVLKADADATFGDDVQTLCTCICALPDLRELKLTRITEYFSDAHVNLIAENLLKLEDLLLDGYGITDDCLGPLSNLGNLKSVAFSGLTSFTSNGLLDFIDALGPGNQGLAISIDRAVAETSMSDPEQGLVRDALAERVQGRFEYQLHRDLDVSDFDQSDSD